MKTRERNVLIVPNSVLSTSSVTNLSMPNSVGRFEISLSLDASIPTDRALRVVEAGVRAAIDERMGLLEEPKPSVKIADTNDIGVEYEIKYYIDASRISPSWARHAVFGSVLDALRQAGLGLAYPKEDVFHAEMPRRQFDSLTEEGKVELLSRQTLFESLRSDELSELARRMHERLFRAGDEIIILGEEGDTMYILVEGLLHVYIDLKGDGDLVRVAHVRPGTFFGEMSLLTGEPRSGTLRAATDVVVYEIDREAVEVLFQKRPEIGEILSHAVAEHRLRDKLARTKMSVEERQIETRNAAQKILGQMKAFFRGVVG